MNRFSSRYKFRKRPIRAIRIEAPSEVRQFLLRYISENEIDWLFAYRLTCDATGTLVDPNNWSSGYTRPVVEAIIGGIEWFKVYDLIEAFASVYGQHFEGYINDVFADAGVAWEMIDGTLEPFDPEGQALKLDIEHEAMISLSASLEPPKEQYIKSLGHLNSRPPDYENAVKDAVGALEGLARILSGDSNLALGEAMGRLFPNPTPEQKVLNAMIKKLQGYRSQVPGSGHGRHRAPDIEFPEAQYVVRAAGSALAYLAMLKREGRFD